MSSLSPVANKSSITLQVSTTNRTSPPSSSGYSSQCQSSNGRSSVLSSASSSAVPLFQDSVPRRSVTVTSESPKDPYGNTTATTTTTTINGSNTKIYVQQQNSPVRSVITFENGVKNNSNTLPSKDIVIVNGFSSHTEGKSNSNEVTNGKCQTNNENSRPKPERPKSLYSPREKSKHDNDPPGGKVERRKFPSLEALNSVVDTSNLEEATKNKLTNNLINTNNNNNKMPSFTHHPNSYPPSTPPTCSDPGMNNTRILRSLSASPALPVKSKENLSYKNVLRSSPSTPLDGVASLNLNREGIKNNFCSNPSSPTKSFDSFGGSYGNLFIEGKLGNDKLVLSNPPKEKELEEKSFAKAQEGGSMDLCPYSSLSDLTVHFKSIAAQKILKGVSINSIDTLVEVNMAAAEKQNNCDVTIHTDFGMV